MGKRPMALLLGWLLPEALVDAGVVQIRAADRAVAVVKGAAKAVIKGALGKPAPTRI